MWIVDLVGDATNPNMLTYSNVADDLAAYRRFLEEMDIDWLAFGKMKQRRPTYRYKAWLTTSARGRIISVSIAKRRMSTVVRFYRWLFDDLGFRPENQMWIESPSQVRRENESGYNWSYPIRTTDLSIDVPASVDPFDTRILDGQKLRALPHNEQVHLVESLICLRNTEMSLIFILALHTGARIQTILTMRVSHFETAPELFAGDDIRLKAGLGTSIDTKKEKRGTIHLPLWLYETLHTYALSERARKRRSRATDGDHSEQLLFLSRSGTMFYQPRNTRHRSISPHTVRHLKTGQAVRQFIKEKLLPEMRKRLCDDSYTFKFHDLRATFGRNFLEALQPAIQRGETSQSTVLDFLRQLLWHSSVTITVRYLKGSTGAAALKAAQEGWNQELNNLAKQAFNSSVANDANS
ncbi:site-specific integrase [Paraburkholderia sp. GAS333]